MNMIFLTKGWFIEKSQGRWGVVFNVLNCDDLVNEFELQSRNYVQFRIDRLASLSTIMELLHLENCSLSFFVII